MGKAAGALGLSITGSIAAAGGIYLSQMNSFDSQLPESLDIFEKPEHLEGCVSSLFPELKSMTPGTGSESSSTGKIDGNFFDENDRQNTEGCLVINWKKDVYGLGENQKWNGDFRLLWSVKNAKATKGFVVFATAKPTTNKKLKWMGNAYSLEQKNTGDKKEWIVNKKASIKENAAAGKEVEFKDKFPKPNSKLIDRENWGWISGENEIDNFQENGNGADNKEEKFLEGYWIWRGSADNKGETKLGEWTDKLEDWWKNTFGENEWNMKGVIGEIKGKWETSLIR